MKDFSRCCFVFCYNGMGKFVCIYEKYSFKYEFSGIFGCQIYICLVDSFSNILEKFKRVEIKRSFLWQYYWIFFICWDVVVGYRFKVYICIKISFYNWVDCYFGFCVCSFD